MEVLDARALRVIDLAFRANRIGMLEEQPEQSVDTPEDRALARRIAASGMVLMKNDGDRPVLPLDPDVIGSVAVIGPNAEAGVIQGGGSAQLSPHHLVSPADGLAAVYGNVVAAPGSRRARYLPLVPSAAWVSDGDRPIALEIFAGTDMDAEPAMTRNTSRIGTMIQGGVAGLPDRNSFSNRWSGTLRIENEGTHQFSVFACGLSRVLINGAVVVDNWTDPTPGDGFFQMASTEVVGAIDLQPGTIEVVVEWTSDPSTMLAGLRFGWLVPTDDDRLMVDAVAAASQADAAVVVVGLDADWETESHDRPIFGLPGRQDELVRTVLAANPNTVVVLNAGGPVDLPWFDDAPAVITAWYPGQEFGLALADVISGAVDPGGRLPMTFPKRVADAPTALDVPGDGSKLHYREGSFVGHRWYDARDIEPLVPFGHGESYTSFEFGRPSVTSERDGAVDIAVEVRNIGNRVGTAVPQLYLEPPVGTHRRPLRTLCGFASASLAAGTTTTMTISVPKRAFEIWTHEAGWHTPAGSYVIHAAASSRDLGGSVSLDR